MADRDMSVLEHATESLPLYVSSAWSTDVTSHHQQQGPPKGSQQKGTTGSGSTRDRSQSCFSAMARYHPYKASGDAQQKQYCPDISSTLGTLSPRYSVPACSALAVLTHDSPAYDAIIGALGVTPHTRLPRSLEVVPCTNATDNRAAVLSRAKHILRDSQNMLMERRSSMTHELEAICSPSREELEAVASPVRSRSAEPQATCDASESDCEDEPESPAATHDDVEVCSLEPEKPFSSPSQEPLGSVPDRVAAFEHLALASQADSDPSMHDTMPLQPSGGSRTPRGTVRGVLACGLPYRLNRISETSERSHATSVAESAFDDSDRVEALMHTQHGAVSLTPRSMCHSLASVDSDATEFECCDVEGATHAAEDSVATGEPLKKGMRPLVPTLQLKHLAFAMPSITEESLGCMPTEAAVQASGDKSATPEDTFNSSACTQQCFADPNTVTVPSMYERPASTFEASNACSNPFLDELEPSNSSEVEESLHNLSHPVPFVHTPRSDLVFGQNVPTSFGAKASGALPTTHSPTPCMSLMHGTDAAAATGVLDEGASGALTAEQPLTPLVDTITCGLPGQGAMQEISETTGDCLKSVRERGSKGTDMKPPGPLKTPRPQSPLLESSLDLLEVPTLSSTPSATTGAVDRLESPLGMLPADASNAIAEIDTPVATDEVGLQCVRSADKSGVEHTKEDKENGGDVLNTEHHDATFTTTGHPSQPLALSLQNSAKVSANTRQSTAQNAIGVVDRIILAHQASVHALLTPRDGEDPSDTAAAAANEAVYNSMGPSSPTQGLITPRNNVPEHSDACVGVPVGALSGGQWAVSASPGGVPCLSALSSPEKLHMHAANLAVHAARDSAKDKVIAAPGIDTTPEATEDDVSPRHNVITNHLFNPSLLAVSDTVKTSMHLMVGAPVAATEASDCAALSSPTEGTAPVATDPRKDQTLDIPSQADASAERNAVVPSQPCVTKEPEEVNTTTDALTCMSPPPLESEPSHCELRDALTLAVQQRDSAVREMHAAAQRSTAASDALRRERDEALSEVAALRHELSQCELSHQNRERELEEKVVALNAKVSEVEKLRISSTEAAALRKALNAMHLKAAQSSAVGPLKRSSRISRSFVGAMVKSGQLFSRLHGPGSSAGCGSNSNGPKWLKGSAGNNITSGSPHDARCAYNCM